MRANKLARISAKKRPTPVGTTFSFVLNEAATVTLTFTRKASGRCTTHTNCELSRVAGKLTLRAHRGVNHVLFQGRVSRTRKLKPGRYKLAITATANGKTSRPSTLNFTIAQRLLA